MERRDKRVDADATVNAKKLSQENEMQDHSKPVRVYLHADEPYRAALGLAAGRRTDVEIVAELAGADCVAYAPGPAGGEAVVHEIGGFLESGKSVVSAVALPESALARLREACLSGRSAVHATGPYPAFLRERMSRRLSRAFRVLETVRAEDSPAGFNLDMAGGSSRFIVEAAFSPAVDGDAIRAATAKALLDAAVPVCRMAPGIVVEDENPRYQMDDRL
jgi:hypothetical protein